jgi:hypothetical protein
MYCVSEGLSNVRNSIANAYPIDPDLNFPEMKLTLLRIQVLIRHCTMDASEWQEISGKKRCEEQNPPERSTFPRSKTVIRVKDKLYLEIYMHINISGNDLIGIIFDTVMQWWTVELQRAEQLESEEWHSHNLGNGRPTLRERSF